MNNKNVWHHIFLFKITEVSEASKNFTYCSASLSESGESRESTLLKYIVHTPSFSRLRANKLVMPNIFTLNVIRTGMYERAEIGRARLSDGAVSRLAPAPAGLPRKFLE